MRMYFDLLRVLPVTSMIVACLFVMFMSYAGKSAEGYFHADSFALSRIAFLHTHLTLFYWFVFLFNDPFRFGANTLDASVVSPPETCSHFIRDNAVYNVALFLLWVMVHSIFAREKVKRALGLWKHPMERPVYSFLSSLVMGLNAALWRPVSNCARWDAFALSPMQWVLPGVIMILSLRVLVGYFWRYSDHAFGTSSHQEGTAWHGLERPLSFPFDLVRYPKAAGFIWILWAIPAYTVNHIFLSALWTAYVLLATYSLDVTRRHHHPSKYEDTLPALFPSLPAVLRLVGIMSSPSSSSLASSSPPREFSSRSYHGASRSASPSRHGVRRPAYNAHGQEM
eukprot:TRINITY_DN4922_c0_g1_i1.p1 TRINITY_DN4922_c0_g1~~TRINITY_DN4922_c0_g1_i1.p1  ORF type:complete len:339 (+),score=38.46 TRINITY_DN4922_c0_g1_i1:346-1362(+)